MKQIVIFGTAQRGSEILAILSHLPGYEAVAFSCNDEARWGTEKEGLEIIPPGDIASRFPGAAVVIASAAYAEIEKRLIAEGNLPSGGCVPIYRIMEAVSEEDRTALRSKVQRKTAFYDLDVREAPIPPDDGSRERYLVICNGGYPAEGNPRCAFAHERVLQYREAGLKVEAFSLVPDARFERYDYQGVGVFQGGMLELERFLRVRDYKKLLIHFIDANVMGAIEKAGKAGTPMIVWCHGYEVMPWHRCWFNFTPDELRRNRSALERQDAEKRAFLRSVYARENMTFLFVSQWQRERSKKFVGELPRRQQVIHNFINHAFYAAPEKTAEDRLRILSVKSHGTRTYANDLTAKAILELSNRSWFPEVTFELYGDGPLFEENFGELLEKNFSNVEIHRRFLNHEQIRELFRQSGVFLSPTRMDSHQVTASEAMAAGLCVITSSAGPMREFVDEACGCVFEFDNYFMLAEEIEFLYFHPEEFLSKAQKAVIRSREQCGYENTIQKELCLLLDGGVRRV